MPRTTSFIDRCSFRGGGPNEQKADTVGIVVNKGQALIQHCQFHQFNKGGVISDLEYDAVFVFRDNALVSCSLVGLYVQGVNSNPIILHNVFMVNKSPGIIINSYVDAFIALNEM
jgi:hypothetical protein